MKSLRVSFTLFLLMIALLVGMPVSGQDTPTPDIIEGTATLIASETATATLEVTITPTPVIVEEPPPNPIPDDEPGELPVTTPETLLGQLYSLLKDGTYIAWAAAGTIIIVGLLKVVASGVGITISGNMAVFITLVVQVLIWIGYAIANYLNQGEAFKTWYLALVDVARSLLPLAGAIFAGHVGFKAAQKRGVPVLGYSAPNPFRGDVTRTTTMPPYPTSNPPSGNG